MRRDPVTQPRNRREADAVLDGEHHHALGDVNQPQSVALLGGQKVGLGLGLALQNRDSAVAAARIAQAE